MKRFYLAILFVLIGVFAFADGIITPPRPYAFGLATQKWWRVRTNVEEFKWVDHRCHTNTALRPLVVPEGETRGNTKVSSGQDTIAEIGPNFEVLTYTIRYGHLNDDKSYDIKNIAPGTYDLINGKWYPEMTDAEKHAKWAVYTNDVIQAILADIAERKAPAKFDVSKSPEEYMKYLLADRDPETLTPEEEHEIRIEYSIYELEWTRVNDPENYKPSLLPKETILTEQQKKARDDRLEKIRARRELMSVRRKTK